jgi:PEP-CTERM/exosortase A-associated glycosyltransferase
VKILHILDHSIPLHSGYTFRTRSILKQQRSFGWETAHLTSGKQGECSSPIEEVEEFRFYRSKVNTRFYSQWPVLNQWAFIEEMAERLEEVVNIEKPDILHGHSPALTGMAALKVRKKTGIPVVYECRGFWEDAAVDHGTCKEGDLRYRMTRAMETHVFKNADAVTTICEGLRADISARGIPDQKITVIPNAVDIERFPVITEKESALLSQLKLNDKTVLGFIGSFYAYEGLVFLVRSLSDYLKSNPNVVLLLVGGGPEDASIKQLVANLGLGEQVILTGRVPHTEVNRYYSLVDIFIYPRHRMRLTDLVTPLKPLEAMAQGKLVIASDVGGHKELIQDGYNGRLFEADSRDSLVSAVDTMILDKANWADLRQHGRDYVEQVRNWENSVSNYRSVYESLLS